LSLPFFFALALRPCAFDESFSTTIRHFPCARLLLKNAKSVEDALPELCHRLRVFFLYTIPLALSPDGSDVQVSS